MRWLWPTLTAALVADALQLRGRIEKVHVLEPSDAPVAPTHRLVTAAGVVVDDATARAASVHALAEGLDVVDLVPADTPVETLLDMLRTLNPRDLRGDPLAKGYGALTAVLVSTDVVSRAQLDTFEHLAPEDMAAIATRLKGYAPRTTDVAIAPTQGGRPAGRHRATVLQQSVGRGLRSPGSPSISACSPTRPAPARRAPSPPPSPVPSSRYWPPVTRRHAPRHRPGTWRWRCPRSPTCPACWPSGPERSLADEAEAKRDEYEKLLADGLDRLLRGAPRPTARSATRRTCTIRASAAPTCIQHKPGEFVARGVRGLRPHLPEPPAQPRGPRLLLPRLLRRPRRASELEGIFAATARRTSGRAEHGPRRSRTPTRWLDVGSGHGHFCLAAQDALAGHHVRRPRHQRDGRRGRAPRAGSTRPTGACSRSSRPTWPGATTWSACSHYLEHTRDPGAELDAAATVLAAGRHVPASRCPTPVAASATCSEVLVPVVPAAAPALPLGREPVAADGRGRLRRGGGRALRGAHPGRLLGLGGPLVNKLYPRIGVPWRPRPTAADRLKRGAAIAAGMPIIAAGTRRRPGRPAYRRPVPDLQRLPRPGPAPPRQPPGVSAAHGRRTTHGNRIPGRAAEALPAKGDVSVVARWHPYNPRGRPRLLTRSGGPTRAWSWPWRAPARWASST